MVASGTGDAGGGAPAGGGSGGPLAGVRVLDLTSVVMGPYATALLGDLGADVIVVEGGAMEPNRMMGDGPHPQLSGVALNLMRNKRSVAVNLKDPAGRQALLAVAATCDAFVTNLRVGALSRARLTYPDLAAVRPDIVYCEAHGYPTGSRRADEPAYDDVIQAAAGVADASRRQHGEPLLAPTILVDKVCGLTIAMAVCAALFRRARTGRGERIEVPMVDTAVAFMLVEHGSAAIPEPPLGRAGYPRVLTPHRRPQRTSDGWIHVLPYSRADFEALFAEAGALSLLEEVPYRDGRDRTLNADALYQRVARIMATRTTAEWLEACRRIGVAVTEVAGLDDLVAALPVATHPVAGDYRVIPPAVRFESAPAGVRRPAPLVGEHTAEVLAE
ncbi:MAG TPA: CoA transferase, partial [Acidimicrobiales bacterium]|nr:CoA transferase [Acidimicrobiales bacterium]